MVVNSLFLWCPLLHRCNVWRICLFFYSGFVYEVLLQAFFLSGACAFDPTIALVGGVCCTVGECDFFVVFFNYLWHVVCASVANLNVVFVKDIA